MQSLSEQLDALRRANDEQASKLAKALAASDARSRKLLEQQTFFDDEIESLESELHAVKAQLADESAHKGSRDFCVAVPSSSRCLSSSVTALVELDTLKQALADAQLTIDR